MKKQKIVGLTESKEDDYRINRARLAGPHKSLTPAEFKNYLLLLGLYKYEKSILPLHLEDSLQAADYETTPETPCAGRKIIPFPGVPLSEPADFQDEVDSFLQEMGYID